MQAQPLLKSKLDLPLAERPKQVDRQILHGSLYFGKWNNR